MREIKRNQPKFKVLSNNLNRDEFTKIVPVTCTRYCYRDSPWVTVFTGTREQCKRFLTRKMKAH